MNITESYLSNKNIFLLTRNIDVVQSYLKEKSANVVAFTSIPSHEEVLLENWDVAFLDYSILREDIEFLYFFKRNYSTLKVIIAAKPESIKNMDNEVNGFADFFLEKPYNRNSLDAIFKKIIYLPLRNKNILIVEDARISLMKMMEIAQALGGNVFGYADIDNETEVLSRNYEIAILDLILKNGTTVDFIEILKEKVPNVHIIVVSALPHALEKNPTSFSMVDFIYPKPWDEKKLEETLIDIVEQPYSERRKSIRKEGIPYCWVSRYNKEMDLNEPFESPFVIDISVDGMSFQSFLDYEKEDVVTIWILNPGMNNTHLLELRGEIRWKKISGGIPPQEQKSYGIMLNKATSRDFLDYQKLIAHYTKIARSSG